MGYKTFRKGSCWTFCLPLLPAQGPALHGDALAIAQAPRVGGAALQEKLPASPGLCLPAPGAARPKRSPFPSVSEEEISNMRSELEKYGIQMPAFGKIGGILANELSLDEAACKRKSGSLCSYWRGFQIRD